MIRSDLHLRRTVLLLPFGGVSIFCSRLWPSDRRKNVIFEEESGMGLVEFQLITVSIPWSENNIPSGAPQE